MHARPAYIAWIYPQGFEARQLMDAAIRCIERPLVAFFDVMSPPCMCGCYGK
jgi:hypothetical protein